MRYFVWKLLYMVATFGGHDRAGRNSAGFAFAAGWFNEPRQHLVPLVLGGIVAVLRGADSGYRDCR